MAKRTSKKLRKKGNKRKVPRRYYTGGQRM
ncbi:hypothetical protein [Vibrio phage vB_VpaM_PG19]|nr:hypothetical protein vBVpPWS1_07 [Vibrio phage vB_VpP_WS1]UKL15211.1 hypothetical protein [Vibrio phage vB_VpaM_PG19]